MECEWATRPLNAQLVSPPRGEVEPKPARLPVIPYRNEPSNSRPDDSETVIPDFHPRGRNTEAEVSDRQSRRYVKITKSVLDPVSYPSSL